MDLKPELSEAARSIMDYVFELGYECHAIVTDDDKLTLKVDFSLEDPAH